MDGYFPIVVILVLSAFIGVLIVVLASILGKERNPTKIKLMPYECGMDPVGDAQRRVPVRFFLIGMLFIVFDIELIFMFPWAIVYDELLIFGFVEMLIFVLVLLFGLVYVWGKGALEWE